MPQRVQPLVWDLQNDAIPQEKAHEEEVAQKEVVPDLEAELDSWIQFNGVPNSENVLPDSLQGVFVERVLASPATRARREAAAAPAVAPPAPPAAPKSP